MRKLFFVNKASRLVVVIAMLAWAGSALASPWSFGVISDTQWTKPDDGKNPNSCAADVIRQVNQQFVKKCVAFVIAVGDTVDVGSKINIETRALYAQELYNAGIGFYPLRGNHEAAEDPNYLLSGPEFQYAFPQIGTGLNNATPADITTNIIPSPDLLLNPPASKNGYTFVVGRQFSYPTKVNAANNSISYSFDYKNARFVLLDQFDVTGSYYNSTISAQQSWISDRLSDSARPRQAFVLIHKNLLGGNHKDNMFGGQVTSADPGDGYGVDASALNAADKATLLSKQQAEDAFIKSLADNNVRLFISGHDHHHYNSIVSAPLTAGKSVHQIIAQSDSSKFYTPVAPFSENDLPVAQDLYRVGYYIVTVDGPRVTVDYYGSDTAFPSAFTTTPALNFVKRNSFGYSLNGKEYLVAEGASYSAVKDSFQGTTAKILGGTNSSMATTNTGRPLTKAVDTGWTRISDSDTNDCNSNNSETKCTNRTDDEKLASDVLTLWGMADLGSNQTDVYTLSISYGSARVSPGQLKKGLVGIATTDDNGNWINAVDMNVGGTTEFVLGPWKDGYKLGTYGVDTRTHTAWAVINYNRDFAVVRFNDRQ